MTIRVHLTPVSRNAKTGPIPVSTTTATTCPTACPFNRSNDGGCYAAGGPLAIHWKAVTEGKHGTDWQSFCKSIEALPDGQLWRHNQAGDLPGEGNAIDHEALGALVAANEGKRGFTYTHKPADHADNAKAIEAANKAGFTVNLSGNNPGHADQLADLAIGPVVTVLPADVSGNVKLTTPAGRPIAVCPATYRDDVTCASCGLCQRANRKVIVGFPAHGTSKVKASKVASRA